MNSSAETETATIAQAPQPGWKRALRSPLTKVAIAIIALSLLAYFNRIKPEAFHGLSERWPWLLAAFALMLPPYAIVSYRFWLVLRIQGIAANKAQATRWTMIGSFFDVCMPSSSGGDVMKAGYVVRHAGKGWKTRSIMAVAFDRILGLLGLFLLAWFASVAGWSMVRDLPQASALIVFLTMVCGGALLAFRILGSQFIQKSTRIQSLIPRLPAGRQIGNFIGTFHALRKQRGLFWAALGLSVLNHLCWCSSLLCICTAVNMSVQPIQGLIVFPLAIFGNLFGFAGGFGVGTAAFDLLFHQLLSLQGGAVVGLLFQVLGALSRLTGLPFFLWSKQHPESVSTEPPTHFHAPA